MSPADFDIEAMVAEAGGGKEAAAAPVIDFDAALISLEGLYDPPLPARYIIDPIIPESEVTGLAGPGKIGKSQASLQIAIHVALGAEWCGMPVKQMPVVYLSAEDQTDVLRNRMKGYLQWKLSLTGERDKTFSRKSESARLAKRLRERLRVVNMRGLGWSLTHQSGGRTVVNETHVGFLAAWIEGEFPSEQPLVLFDTVGRFDEGTESNADYKLLVMALDLLQKRTGCTVLLIAHTSQQATLEKRLDLTAMRGGLHLGNSVRSMLVMSGHRLGHKDELLEQQGAVPPKESDLGQGYYAPLDIEGVSRGDRLSVIVHTDSNVGATRRPLWFMRGAFKSAGVLAPVEFVPDLEGRKEERAERREAEREERTRKRISSDCKAVLDFIRKHQDDPDVFLTKNHLRSREATNAIGFGKDRVMAALEALGEAVVTVDREDGRERRNAVVQVYRVAQERV